MYLFKWEFSPDISPGVGLQDHMVALFLVFKGTSILFSIVAAPVYIPTNSVWRFFFLWEPFVYQIPSKYLVPFQAPERSRSTLSFSPYRPLSSKLNYMLPFPKAAPSCSAESRLFCSWMFAEPYGMYDCLPRNGAVCVDLTAREDLGGWGQDALGGFWRTHGREQRCLWKCKSENRNIRTHFVNAGQLWKGRRSHVCVLHESTYTQTFSIYCILKCILIYRSLSVGKSLCSLEITRCGIKRTRVFIEI